MATALLGVDAPPAARLWALCAWDARLLVEEPFNIGSLYLQPEVDDEFFAEFPLLRSDLRDAYAQLVSAVGRTTEALVPDLVLGLVGSVILLRRRDPAGVDDRTAALVADCALRLVGVPGPQLPPARRRERQLLTGLHQLGPVSEYTTAREFIRYYLSSSGDLQPVRT